MIQAALRILVPACNESNRIAPMLTDYCRRFKGRAIVTVIANACTDDTVPIVERLMEAYDNLQLIVVNGRIGKGGAIRVGFKTGDEAYVGFADADGSTDAAEFDRLFSECVKCGSDGVIGSRWLPGAEVFPRQPPMRRIASRAFNSIVRLLFGLPFADTQCGAKIFRRDAIRAVLPALEIADFAFDIDLLFNIKRHGFRIVELPTRWADSAAGTKVRILKTSLCMFKATLRLRLQESWFWRLPFAEMLARNSIIPVKDGVSVLLICPRKRDAWEASFIDVLRAEGCRIALGSEIASSPFGLLLWYIFHSRRRYDAIIELPSNSPALIPVISGKRCFVVRSRENHVGPTATWIYGAMYGRSHHISSSQGGPSAKSPLYGVQPLLNSLPETAARYVIDYIGAGPIYRAVFQYSSDGWQLRFSDIESGSWVHQQLN